MINDFFYLGFIFLHSVFEFSRLYTVQSLVLVNWIDCTEMLWS